MEHMSNIHTRCTGLVIEDVRDKSKGDWTPTGKCEYIGKDKQFALQYAPSWPFKELL